MSKYAHQRPARTTMPRVAAATMLGVSATPAPPMPIAMIDSPSAMMTMRPEDPERGLRTFVEEGRHHDDHGCQVAGGAVRTTDPSRLVSRRPATKKSCS
jgi:hypothetical protein